MNICEECFKDAMPYFNLAKHSKYIALGAKYSNLSMNNVFMTITCLKAFSANKDT